MVKLQKPIPKKLGNKAKLDNPIKNKKHQNKKEKTNGTVKNINKKLLETPIKEAKVANKATKEGTQSEQVLQKSKRSPKQSLKGSFVPPQKQNDKPRGKKTEIKGAALKTIAPIKTNAPSKAAAKVKAPVKPATAKVTVSVKDATPVDVSPPAKAVASVKTAAPIKATAPVKIPHASKVASVKTTASKKTPLVKVVGPIKPNGTSNKQTPPCPPKEPVQKPKANKNKKNKKKSPAVSESGLAVEQTKVEKKVRKLQEKKIKKINFKKAKRVSAGKKEVEPQEKKERFGAIFDPVPYDEDKFNAIVTQESISKIILALKTEVEKEVANKKSTIFDDYQYFLQVGSFKIPNCPKRMVKLNLKHSLVDKDDDVLLVVPDLQRGAKVDYEPTVHHWEDLLRSQGVEGIKIMSMNQIRKEYGTYELKRRLLASYDLFLCDGRIVGHVTAIVGKICQKPRHTFHAVRLDVEQNIKREIEKSLLRTAYRQVAKATLTTIPVGTHKFTALQVAENITFVVSQLKKHFPGGLGNVRNLYVKIGIAGTSALPLYLSMAQAPDQTPTIVGQREQRMIKLKREANEVLSKFAMTKEGKLIKLTKAEVEKKRSLQEMKAALKDDEAVPTKKVKKSKAAASEAEKVKELELPENEEDDDDDSSDDDAVQLAGSSDDEEDDSEEMGQLDQEEDDESIDAESESEIVENGLADEESDAEDEQHDDDDDNEDDEEEADDDEGSNDEESEESD